MNFRTSIDLPTQSIKIDTTSHVMLIGSCFATAMGTRLTDALPIRQTDINPFGVLYNPHTICRALCLLESGTFPEEVFFVGKDGLWHSWLHDGKFSATSLEKCRQKVGERFEQSVAFLKKADVIALTWGTAHVYELSGKGVVVGNCHKEPSSYFSERRLTVDEIVGMYLPILCCLHERNPQLQIVLTVSPYRYAKLGFHGSTLSKAILHLAAERLTKELDFVHYFPAYELIMDELRDYRFYERDMLHPSEQAADYIWECFMNWSFTEKLMDYAHDKAALLRAERHRPLHPYGATYEQFCRKFAELQQNFNEKWHCPSYAQYGDGQQE